MKPSIYQNAILDFAHRYPGWHSLGGSGNPNSPTKRAARALELRGCLEVARHSGEWGRDWQLRKVQS